jgi:hypothetical protein
MGCVVTDVIKMGGNYALVGTAASYLTDNIYEAVKTFPNPCCEYAEKLQCGYPAVWCVSVRAAGGNG